MPIMEDFGKRYDYRAHHVPGGRHRIARPTDQQRLEQLRRSAKYRDGKRIDDPRGAGPHPCGKRLHEQQDGRRGPQDVEQREGQLAFLPRIQEPDIA